VKSKNELSPVCVFVAHWVNTEKPTSGHQDILTTTPTPEDSDDSSGHHFFAGHTSGANSDIENDSNFLTDLSGSSSIVKAINGEGPPTPEDIIDLTEDDISPGSVTVLTRDGISCGPVIDLTGDSDDELPHPNTVMLKSLKCVDVHIYLVSEHVWQDSMSPTQVIYRRMELLLLKSSLRLVKTITWFFMITITS
jgi:hypothetical protein